MDVVVVGSCMIDMICYTPRIPQPGETLHGTSFEMGNGGKGANQCVAAANLGASTAMIGVLGNDVFGQRYKDYLRDKGVNVDHLHNTEDAHSGMAQITVTENGENCIVIVPGSNSLLSFEHIEKASDIVLGAKVIVFQLETPLETTLKTLKFVKERGNCITIVNAAPAVPNLPDEVFHYTDVFCVNEIEAGQLAGFPVTDVESAKKAVEHFKCRGCKTVIITMGAKGVVHDNSDGSFTHHTIRAMKAKVVDTTGAGDAFVGALALNMAQFPRLPFSTQISNASYIATESVKKKGTQSSYPMKSELPQALFNSNELLNTVEGQRV